MNINLEISTDSLEEYKAGILKVNNEINYKQYRKICVEAVAALSWYNGGSEIRLSQGETGDYYSGDASICYEYPISEKTVFELNIYELEEIEDIYFYIQATGVDGPAECSIYNVWLEK